MSDVTVKDNPNANRYEVSVDGELAGFAEYRLRGDEGIDFTHTEVFERFSGQGLAQQLAAAALDSARERGLAVRPYCAFIKKYIQKNPEYVDLVPAEARAEFDLA